MRCNQPRQLDLDLPRHGGKRPGAGRKPGGLRSGVRHAARPSVDRHSPVHVTMRLRRGAPNLRRRSTFVAVWRSFQSGRERFGGRLVQYSVQHNHLHLILEAQDKRALSRCLQGLAIRIAKALNKTTGGRGKLFADRYHVRVLRTPREVRHALTYVLNNVRKHAAELGASFEERFDRFSSAPFFDGWKEGPVAFAKPFTGSPPVAAPTAWLLTTGWRRHGLIALREIPGPIKA